MEGTTSCKLAAAWVNFTSKDGKEGIAEPKEQADGSPPPPEVEIDAFLDLLVVSRRFKKGPKDRKTAPGSGLGSEDESHSDTKTVPEPSPPIDEDSFNVIIYYESDKAFRDGHSRRKTTSNVTTKDSAHAARIADEVRSSPGAFQRGFKKKLDSVKVIPPKKKN